jgi:hypothetical protein
MTLTYKAQRQHQIRIHHFSLYDEGPVLILGLVSTVWQRVLRISLLNFFISYMMRHQASIQELKKFYPNTFFKKVYIGMAFRDTGFIYNIVLANWNRT